jgi:hypothetical protein
VLAEKHPIKQFGQIERPLVGARPGKKLMEPAPQFAAGGIIVVELIKEPAEFRGIYVAVPVLFAEFENRPRFPRADNPCAAERTKQGNMRLSEGHGGSTSYLRGE